MVNTDNVGVAFEGLHENTVSLLFHEKWSHMQGGVSF